MTKLFDQPSWCRIKWTGFVIIFSTSDAVTGVQDDRWSVAVFLISLEWERPPYLLELLQPCQQKTSRRSVPCEDCWRQICCPNPWQQKKFAIISSCLHDCQQSSDASSYFALLCIDCELSWAAAPKSIDHQGTWSFYSVSIILERLRTCVICIKPRSGFTSSAARFNDWAMLVYQRV